MKSWLKKWVWIGPKIISNRRYIDWEDLQNLVQSRVDPLSALIGRIPSERLGAGCKANHPWIERPEAPWVVATGQCACTYVCLARDEALRILTQVVMDIQRVGHTGRNASSSSRPVCRWLGIAKQCVSGVGARHSDVGSDTPSTIQTVCFGGKAREQLRVINTDIYIIKYSGSILYIYNFIFFTVYIQQDVNTYISSVRKLYTSFVLFQFEVWSCMGPGSNSNRRYSVAKRNCSRALFTVLIVSSFVVWFPNQSAHFIVWVDGSSMATKNIYIGRFHTFQPKVKGYNSPFQIEDIIYIVLHSHFLMAVSAVFYRICAPFEFLLFDFQRCWVIRKHPWYLVIATLLFKSMQYLGPPLRNLWLKLLQGAGSTFGRCKTQMLPRNGWASPCSWTNMLTRPLHNIS